MTAARYALVDAAGVVQNVILCAPDFAPPAGLSLVQSDTAGIGQTYANGVFTAPAPSRGQPGMPTPREWFEALPPADQATVVKAAMADATGQTMLWLMKATGSSHIDVTAAETIAGVTALQNAGVISAADAQILLAPPA